jgi:thymidylate synthase (FAD)
MQTATLGVHLIGWTRFDSLTAHDLTGLEFDESNRGGSALVEFAGRACYQSWTKPNPATATNAGYIAHLLNVGHYSVLEHGSASFYLTGVSRSFTHELVRHRHLSFSQLSQRYVAGAGHVVEPTVIADDPYLHSVFMEAAQAASRAYSELLHALERKMGANPTCPTCRGPVHRENDPASWWCSRCQRRTRVDDAGVTTAGRKQARQAARAVLPNATETRIVVTGNYRAWRHFVDMRATTHADVEIREVAVAILRELQCVAPPVFADYRVEALPDGTEAASSPHAERS